MAIVSNAATTTVSATAACRSTSRPSIGEEIVAAVPGARATTFAVPRLPPLPSLVPLIALLAAACRDRDAVELEELALDFAGAVVAGLHEAGSATRAPSRRIERRISDAVRRIESDEEVATQQSLSALAHDAAMSPYHFLRVFREVVGMTPHQYVLRTRMHRAAMQLRLTNEPISSVAFDAGFNDLSTFNRRFRRILGRSPTAYRTRRAAEPRRQASRRTAAGL